MNLIEYPQSYQVQYPPDQYWMRSEVRCCPDWHRVVGLGTRLQYRKRILNRDLSGAVTGIIVPASFEFSAFSIMMGSLNVLGNKLIV